MLAELSGLPPELLLSCDAQPLSEFYADDLSDTDDVAASRGLMVHSESTMTVVARPGTSESDEPPDTSTQTSSAVLSDAEARRLHHSKSWPQSADGNRAAAAAGYDGVTVAVYGNQRFNFNLPHNTSAEHLYADALAADRFADQSIIYLSSSAPSVDDDRQIAYITDELCRIFCTDTASLEDEDEDAGPAELMEGEMPASVQQHCLEVIPCDCRSSVDGMPTAADRTSSSVCDITILQSAAAKDSDPVTTRPQSGQDVSLTDGLSVSVDSPSSTLTVNPADDTSSPTVSELSPASDDADPASYLSTAALPCVEVQATSTDSVSVSVDLDVVTLSSDVVEVAADDVTVAMSLQESDRDVDELTSVSATSLHVADGDIKSTASSSSANHCHLKRSSPTPVIDTDAAKVDCTKFHSWSQTWHCEASNNVEPTREHERYVSLV